MKLEELLSFGFFILAAAVVTGLESRLELQMDGKEMTFTPLPTWEPYPPPPTFQPETFQPQSFQPETFQPQTFEPWPVPKQRRQEVQQSETETGTGGSDTSTASAVSSSPTPSTWAPMTQGGINTLYNNFPFLRVFEQIVFEQCNVEIQQRCEPDMRTNFSGITNAWSAASGICRQQYCNCLPGGQLQISATTGKLVCSYLRPATPGAQCAMYEYCIPVYDQCVANFVYANDTLPQSCEGFKDCTRRPNVESADLASCIAFRKTQAPPCNHNKTCGFIRDHVNVDVNDAKAYAAYGYGDSDATGISITLLAAIGVCIVVLVVVMVYAVVRHRAIREHEEAEAEARLLSSDELRRVTVQQVKWYGNFERPNVDRQDDDAETSPSSAGDPRCTFCSAPGATFLLLPCRCYWCGCQPPTTCAPKASPKEKSKANADTEGGKKATASTSTPARPASPSTASPSSPMCKPLPRSPPVKCMTPGCGSEVEEAIDAAQLDPKLATISAPGGEESESRRSSPSEDSEGASCVVCLGEAAEVAFFPCGHKATCAECGKRITSGDAIHANTQVQSYATGERASCQCPLCRTGIKFAVLFSAAPSATSASSTKVNESASSARGSTTAATVATSRAGDDDTNSVVSVTATNVSTVRSGTQVDDTEDSSRHSTGSPLHQRGDQTPPKSPSPAVSSNAAASSPSSGAELVRSPSVENIRVLAAASVGSRTPPDSRSEVEVEAAVDGGLSPNKGGIGSSGGGDEVPEVDVREKLTEEELDGL